MKLWIHADTYVAIMESLLSGKYLEMDILRLLQQRNI